MAVVTTTMQYIIRLLSIVCCLYIQYYWLHHHQQEYQWDVSIKVMSSEDIRNGCGSVKFSPKKHSYSCSCSRFLSLIINITLDSDDNSLVL